MKSFAVFSMAMLVVLSPIGKSNTRVSFGVQIKVEKEFSAKNLNLKISEGFLSEGETVVFEKHDDYLRAMKDKYTVAVTGNKAEIIAFFMDKKIGLDDAFALLNDYNIYEKEMDGKLPEPNNEFYYAIEILTSDSQSLSDYLKICPEFEKWIMQKQENIFVIGHIASHHKALEVQEKLSAAGFKNNVVVAYEGKKQVPVYIVSHPSDK